MSNTQFTQIDNTVVSGTSVTAAQNSAGQIASNFRVLKGTFTPTAAGNYAVNDADGNVLQLPATSYVQQSVLTAPTTLVGGTNADVGGAASSGGAVVTTLTGGAQALAAINAGVNTVSDAILGATNYFVSATTTGTFTAGTVQVMLFVVDN